MAEIDDLQKARRENARWRVLKILDAARPCELLEDLILDALRAQGIDITQHELRRELDYLRDRKLIQISGEDTPRWRAELTHYGVDIVEYTVECFPGIARPKKW